VQIRRGQNTGDRSNLSLRYANVAHDSTDAPPTFQSNWLCPYASFLILQCVGDDWPSAFQRLIDFLKRYRTSNATVTWNIVASGLGDIASFARTDQINGYSFDDLDGFIHERLSNPSWAKHDSPYRETSYSLTIALRRDSLIAVHCDSILRGVLQKWLDRAPKPPIRRVASELLQGAFLTGEAKGLWLRGTHARRTTKADSKNLSGRRLQDALSPFEDSSFAMSTARAALPDDPSRTALTGNVGTTPRRALVWNRPTPEFRNFVAVAVEALELIVETMKSGSALVRPYPILASESHDLSVVYGAYDVTTLTPDDLPAIDVSDDLMVAADTLQQSVLKARGYPNSPDLLLDVGIDGALGGSLRVVVKSHGDGVRFVVGFDAESQPTNLPAVRKIKDALDFSAELLTVYYDSGHMVDGRSIWKREVRTAPFPCWSFQDFTGYDITREKPIGKSSPTEIHAGIGLKGDDSLFNWVAHHYSTGWLTCDDGTGEVADFVHVSQSGVLSLIHVKAANSRSATRRIAVGSYEVVASQAAKNFVNLDPNELRDRLTAPTTFAHATWTHGVRVTDRVDFIDAMDSRNSNDEYRVIIVQPHVSERAYDNIRKPGSQTETNEDSYRLDLLETLLNTIRGSVTSLGADMQVIGSKV
jgi:hypothetical protein